MTLRQKQDLIEAFTRASQKYNEVYYPGIDAINNMDGVKLDKVETKSITVTDGTYKTDLKMEAYSVMLVQLSKNSQNSNNSKTVFLSSATYKGNLGGLAGADAKCQALADTAGIGNTPAKQRSFKAWLSDSKTAVKDRFTHAIAPYKLVNGKIIASNWTDLVDGALAAPISITEKGKSVSTFRFVWTNTNSQGDRADTSASLSCADWNTAERSVGRTGSSAHAIDIWTYSRSFHCGLPERLYCVEQ